MIKEKLKAKSGQAITIKQIILIPAIFALYFVIMALPTPAGLPPEGQKAIAFMICVMLTWVTQIFPLHVSSVLFLFLIPVLKLNTYETVAVKFAGETIFFMFASFLLAIALETTGLAKRLALSMSALSKGNPKTLILLIMSATALVSCVISNVPCCAAFLPIVLALCKKNNCVRGSSNFAKAAIIGVIYASMVANGTPAGTPINIVGLSMLKDLTGLTISFGGFSLFGMTITLISIPVLWLILMLVFPPEFKRLAGVEDYKKELTELGPMNKQEIKYLIITALMLVMWFTDKYHGLSTTTTTVIFGALYFLPGINLLKYEDIKGKIEWSIIIMTGATIAFGATMASTGAAKWLADISLMPFANASPVLLIVIISIFCTLSHLLIPSCPAAVAVLVPVLAVFSQQTGINAMLLFLPVIFTVSNSWLLPYADPLPMMCWPEKYFSVKDFIKAGALAHIALIIIVTAVVILIGRPLGYI